MQKVYSNKNNSNCKKNFSKIILLIFFMTIWRCQCRKKFVWKKKNMAQMH